MPKKKVRMTPRVQPFTDDEQVALVNLASAWSAKLSIIEDGIRILRLEPLNEQWVIA